MPVNWIDVNPAPRLPWQDVLDLCKECIDFHIQPLVTGARVYSNWVYEIDHQTMLGKVTPQLIATEGTSAGKVHCWTLGINTHSAVKNSSGATEYVGGQGAQWDTYLELAVWGLFAYDGTKAAQAAALLEAQIIAEAFHRNADNMMAEISYLNGVDPLEFGALQPTPFSDGKQISVAAGAMRMKVKESLNL